VPNPYAKLTKNNVGMVHKRRLIERKLHESCPMQNNYEKSNTKLAKA
jgi:hypothetical protein